jgi:hypothetical protein
VNKEYLLVELAKECELQAKVMGFYICSDPQYRNKICLKALPTNPVWAKGIVLEAFESYIEIAAFIRGWDKHRLHKLAEEAKK